MAARQRTGVYRTNGSVAYAPAYSGNVVRNPRRQEEQYTVPKRNVRRAPTARPEIRQRQAGAVAPFAVAGFLAVGVFAVLVLLTCLQIHAATAQVVSLRSQLDRVQTENATLSAQYEQIFDLEHLQAAVGSAMVRPTSDQVTYIDMSRPDSVVVYADAGIPGVAGAVRGVQEVFSNLIEYFR